MKQLSAVMITGISLFILNSNTFSQSCIPAPKTTSIEPYHLSIAFYKTTNLIFPYAIKSVDRGSHDVLAQKAKAVENILLVKAGKENFRETNLSVITSDGKLYSFLLDYSANPSILNLFLFKDTNTEESSSVLPLQNNEAGMALTEVKVARQKQVLHRIRDSRYKMLLRLNGLYIKKDLFYFQLELQNHSAINYDIEGLRFFIRDEKRAKRTALQEIELQPLYVYGDTSVVKGDSQNILVFALPKFTIPDQKYLIIQLMERNGGRHLEVKVYNRTIVKAKVLEY